MLQKKVLIQGVNGKQDGARKQEEVDEQDKVFGEGILDEGVKEVDKMTEIKARYSMD